MAENVLDTLKASGFVSALLSTFLGGKFFMGKNYVKRIIEQYFSILLEYFGFTIL